MTKLLGEKMRVLRKEKGYSLDQMAKLAGMSKSRLWELENRPNQTPTILKLSKIAEALEVTPEYLMAPEPGPPGMDEIDRAFFRKYKELPDDTKKKLRQLIKVWSEGE